MTVRVGKMRGLLAHLGPQGCRVPETTCATCDYRVSDEEIFGAACDGSDASGNNPTAAATQHMSKQVSALPLPVLLLLLPLLPQLSLPCGRDPLEAGGGGSVPVGSAVVAILSVLLGEADAWCRHRE